MIFNLQPCKCCVVGFLPLRPPLGLQAQVARQHRPLLVLAMPSCIISALGLHSKGWWCINIYTSTSTTTVQVVLKPTDNKATYRRNGVYAKHAMRIPSHS